MQQDQTIKILTDLTKKDIEKVLKTKAYYSQRYGWTLKRYPVDKPANIIPPNK